VMEIGGFTHIENIPARVSHQVDAGAVGQTLQKLLNKIANQLHSSDNIQVYSSIADTRSKDF